MDRGDWPATVHGATKIRTPLSNYHLSIDLTSLLKVNIDE